MPQRFNPTHVIINAGLAIPVVIEREYNLYTKKEWYSHTISPDWVVERPGFAKHLAGKVTSPFYKIVAT